MKTRMSNEELRAQYEKNLIEFQAKGITFEDFIKDHEDEAKVMASGDDALIEKFITYKTEKYES